MISARHLVPGRALLANAFFRVIDERSPLGFYDDCDRALCMVVSLTQARRRTTKKGPGGWSVLVIWLDSRCEPRVQTVHVPVNNDWELAW